jgi:RNA polymerase sigma factor (sigma-70 family)
MTDPDDPWRIYVRTGSHDAFAQIVRRHVDAVYSQCRRQLGNAASAEEATQTVFFELSQKASRLPRDVVLSGWLFKAARFVCAKIKRNENRRRKREQRAAMMRPEAIETKSEDAWSQAEPMLDDAIAELGERDRDALLLRFFEGMSMRQVALAIGVSEDAAKQRISRAVEKLRIHFRGRGLAVPSATVVTWLGAAVKPAGAHVAQAAITFSAAKCAALATNKLAWITHTLWTLPKAAVGFAVTGAMVAVTVTSAVLLQKNTASAPAQVPAVSIVTSEPKAAGARIDLGGDRQQLFDLVKRNFTASRNAIKSLEVDFTFSMNGPPSTQVRYVRSGEKLYFASTTGVESAWDGSRAQNRGFGQLAISRAKGKLRVDTPPPDDALTAVSINRIFNMLSWDLSKPSTDREDRLVAARSIQQDGEYCIELEFDEYLNGALDCHVLLRHSPAHGYWPIYVLLTAKDGSKFYEVPDVQYAVATANGKELFYPVSFSQNYANSTTYRVDRATLRMNQPVDSARFNIEPWPNELVADADAAFKPIRKPVDRNWSPGGKVSFPWDIVLGSVKNSSDAAARQKAEDKLNAAVANAASPAEKARILADIAANEQTPTIERITPVLAAFGIITIIGAGLYTYQRRRRAA